MKEIIDQIVAKVGISEEQAQGSVVAVLDFLKDKLPGPIADQLENFVNGDGKDGSNPLDAAKDAIGGFFNKD
ncbi:MAG: hypothetical protein ACI8XO_000214 [Verrucomicrobiales bacterium]|jgi:hypothetical protein